MERIVDRRALIGGAAVLGALSAAGVRAAVADEDTAASTGAFDIEADFVVVGSGGGTWGALAAIDAGAESVVILEKGNLFGGTTSLSGGALWVPMNYTMDELGVEDSREAALAYIAAQGLEGSDPEVAASYVDNGHAFVEWARDTLGFVWVTNSANRGHDYYPGCEGYVPTGRACEVDPVASAQSVLGEAWDAPASRSNAGTFQILRALCDRAGVDVHMGTAATELVMEDGRVVGVCAVNADGNPLRVGAHKGVLLATGGFDYNPELCRAFLRTPIKSTLLLPTCTGDGHRMGIRVGAALANTTSFYGTCVMLPEGEFEGVRFVGDESVVADLPYRYLPGSVVVNRRGRRIGNESAAYANFACCLEGWDSASGSRLNLPAYWVCGGEYTAQFPLPGAAEVGEEPGWLVKADSLEELAEKLGIDPEAFGDEMAAYNQNAAQGVDPVWHRGEFGYDQVSSVTVGAGAGLEEKGADGTNVCVAPVATPPFYGTRLYLGSLGTSGGLKIDGNAQVHDVDGNVIPGLYACGCCAASPFGMGYGGAGGPVGATCVMAWVAARAAMSA